MSKLYTAKTTSEKLDMILKNQLPTFAGRFFRDNKGIMSDETLYGYSVDIASFFLYLQDVNGVKITEMTLKYLESVTESEIENYMEFSQYYVHKGVKKQKSICAIRRRLAALNSFYLYYYRNDLINVTPTLRIAPPRLVKNASETPNFKQNTALLNFILNDSLDGEKIAAHQENYRIRDAAIVSLLICSGLKTSEIINLDISDLQLEKHAIFIKERALPHVVISTLVVNLISEYLNNYRFGIITEYGHENALFLSSRGQRIASRTVQYMVKKYTTALFGHECKIAPCKLRQSYREAAFNTIQSVSNTALICGISEDTIIKTHRADLNDRFVNTIAHYPIK